MVNRAQRRHQLEPVDARARGEPVPLAPLYQVDLRTHLGADVVWKRPENRNNRRVIQARAPDLLWDEVARQLLEILGLADPMLVMGLFLNLINRWPDEERTRMLVGILEGHGLTLERDPPDLVASLGPKKDVEGNPVFQPLAHVTPEGDTLTPSGLVIPAPKV